MSPQYEPPPRKVGRLTAVNLAFLGLNAVIGVALLYGLWRGGRAVFGPASPPAGSSTIAGNPGAPPSSASSASGTPTDPTDPSAPGSPSSHASTSGQPNSSSNAANTSNAPNASNARSGASPPSAASLSGSPATAPVRTYYSGTAASSTSTDTGGSSRPGSAATAPSQAAGAPAAQPTGSAFDPRTGAPIPTTIARGAPGPGTSVPDHGTNHDPNPSAPSAPPSTPPPAPPAPPPIDIEPGSDRTPPTLDSLTFDPPQVADGGAANLVIHVHDDLSGVRAVNGNVKSPSGSAIFSFQGQSDGSGTTFIARIPIPAKAETGLWYVANIFVPDQADNTLIGSFTPATAPPGGTLNVTSMQGDSTPPVVRSVSLQNGSVRGGERNRVTIDIVDDVSGVATVAGAFQSPGHSALIPFAAHQDPDSTTWSGDLSIPSNADCGEWTIQQLRAADSAGNNMSVPADSPVLSRVGFDVVTDGCDSVAPTLDTLELSPSSVSNEAASDIVVTAVVHDDGSGAVSVSGWAQGPVSTNGNAPTLSFACGRSNPKDPDSPWVGKIHVPQYAATGIWKMGRMRVMDRAQNVREYTPTDAIMGGATFDVH